MNSDIFLYDINTKKISISDNLNTIESSKKNELTLKWENVEIWQIPKVLFFL